jgi:glycolate oxidase FAD binding subunit
LGVLVELTFKVFPQPETYTTLRVDLSGLRAAVTAIQRLTTSHLEMDALDLEPPGRLWIRLGGLAEALPDRRQRMAEFLQKDAAEDIRDITTLNGEAEVAVWQQAREFSWVPEDWGLIKVPLTPARLLVLEERLDGWGAKRRYSVGGNVGWLAWSPEDDSTTFFNTPDSILTRLDLPGQVLFGPAGSLFVGLRSGEALLSRVKQALDPQGRFLTY